MPAAVLRGKCLERDGRRNWEAERSGHRKNKSVVWLRDRKISVQGSKDISSELDRAQDMGTHHLKPMQQAPALSSRVLNPPTALWAKPASFSSAPAAGLGLIHGADPGAVLMSLPGGAVPGPPNLAAPTPAVQGRD